MKPWYLPWSAVGLLLGIASFVRIAEAVGNCTSSQAFDFMYLVQFWPPTQCELYGCASQRPNFSIHGSYLSKPEQAISCKAKTLFSGLWPNDFNGDWPCNCSGPSFNLNLLPSTLVSSMVRSYRTLHSAQAQVL